MGGDTIIAFVTDPDGYKIEIIQDWFSFFSWNKMPSNFG
jgi:hypothetical protein